MIDWDKCETIDSDSEIPDIERHFRVFAGPGAGKTHWLITLQRYLANFYVAQRNLACYISRKKPRNKEVGYVTGMQNTRRSLSDSEI